MAHDPQSLRRRATLAACAPLLDGDALAQALWLAHDHLRGDGASDVIACVDRMSAAGAVDDIQRKKLYSNLFAALRMAHDALPDDPWQAMQMARGLPAAATTPAPTVMATPPQPAPAQASEPAIGAIAPPPPVMPAPLAAPEAPPEPASTGAPRPALEPHQAVFSAMVAAVLDEIRQFHRAALQDLRQECTTASRRAKIAAPVREQFQHVFTLPADFTAPAITGSPDELADLTHLLYVALCEAIGPVDADQTLTRAVRTAERLPEAQRFPPSRLL